jgi:hypothetical protein
LGKAVTKIIGISCPWVRNSSSNWSPLKTGIWMSEIPHAVRAKSGEFKSACAEGKSSAANPNDRTSFVVPMRFAPNSGHVQHTLMSPTCQQQTFKVRLSPKENPELTMPGVFSALEVYRTKNGLPHAIPITPMI